MVVMVIIGVLARIHVRTSDARPAAWSEAGRLSTRERLRERLAEWLDAQFAEADELIIKDPRLVKMRDKLKTDDGRRRYAKRKQTVEPVFGIIKDVIGFRRFLLRGTPKVNGEWSLVRLAYNIKRLFTLQAAI